jgi:hypothetical protein
MSIRPIKALPHEARDLFGAFHRTEYVIFRAEHILTECPSSQDQARMSGFGSVLQY